jgi:hypothetical protein
VTDDAGSSDASRPITVIAVAGVGLLLAAALLIVFRHRFDWAFELVDIPTLQVATGLVVAGALYLVAVSQVGRLTALPSRAERRVFAGMVAVGVVARLAMMLVEPVLEDDYHRYLWDGAMVANGLDPYAVAPEDAAGLTGTPRAELAEQSGVIVERINHPYLRTMYPPVAEAFFALSYLLKPWSMTAWRLVCLGGEIATLLLLLALLGAAGHARLWALVYWWNPLAIKETINSGHMEAVLMPLVLGALLLSVRRRPIAATGVLALAAGTKLWPAMLAPVILRPLLGEPRRLVAAVALIGGACLLWMWPLYRAGLDDTSGFVAYAQNWKTNSALFPTLESLARLILSPFALAATAPGGAVRALSAAVLGAVALWLARTPAADAGDLLWRAGAICALLVLLSPAQFPWYYLWLLPFLAIHPIRSLLAATVLLPIYYASFYFHARDTYDIYRTWIVWVIWIPIWGLMVSDFWAWRSAQGRGRTHAA